MAMMTHRQVYRQSNRHEASFEILPMKAPKKMIQYRKLDANAVKQYHDNDMPPTNVPIKGMMKK